MSSASEITAESFYKSEGLRDPFAAVMVSSSKKAVLGKAVSQAVPKFDKLTLAGIFLYASGKQAMIYDSSTGLSYFLVKGKLYNQKRKPIPGVSGIAQDKQVTLIASNKTVTLKLPDKGRKESR